MPGGGVAVIEFVPFKPVVRDPIWGLSTRQLFSKKLLFGLDKKG
jgi:hypothetical protein